MASKRFALGFGGRDEEITTVFGGETFEEFAVGGCQAVVELVTRGPKGVCEASQRQAQTCIRRLTSSALRRELPDLQTSVVRRRRFKAMATYGSVWRSGCLMNMRT
jgi:hypothetical protein